VGFRKFLHESPAKKVVRMLRDADDNNELANIGNAITAIKKDKRLEHLEEMAVDLQNSAKTFDKSQKDSDYDVLEGAFDKLILNLENV